MVVCIIPLTVTIIQFWVQRSRRFTICIKYVYICVCKIRPIRIQIMPHINEGICMRKFMSSSCPPAYLPACLLLSLSFSHTTSRVVISVFTFPFRCFSSLKSSLALYFITSSTIAHILGSEQSVHNY